MKKHLITDSIIIILIIVVTSLLSFIAVAYNPDKTKDTDNDGLTDYEEKAIYQTYWYDPDTDKDGYPDGHEVENGYSPKQKNLKMTEADTDNDGLNDAWEIKFGTNLMIRDTDGDGYLDGTEVYQGYSPTSTEPVKTKKRIEVNIDNFDMDIYQGAILLESFKVSTGRPSSPTPIGEFTIEKRVPIKHYYGYPNTPWNLLFTHRNGWGYYIHTAYWHEKFGQENVSGGCVNVKQEEMERIYKWANEGTQVIIK